MKKVTTGDIEAKEEGLKFGVYALASFLNGP